MSPRTILSVVRHLEGDERLDAFAERVQAAVSRGAACLGRRRDLLSGTAFGHPAHPAVVPITIGCLMSAIVADLAGQRSAARTLVGVGVIAAVPTALTGLSDWADTDGAERRIGFLHLSTNAVAVTLYAKSWLARRQGRYARGLLLSLAGASVMTAAGWLGGHLSYGMGVGVDTTAFQGGPTEWTEIAQAGDAPGGRTTVEGVALAIFEDDDGNPRVLAARCTHRGGPLSDGEVAGGCVTCPWHGSKFDIVDGHVVRGPATQPQPVYEARVSCDGTEVRRDEPRSLRRNPV